MLGIKTVVHLTPETMESLEKEFSCIHVKVQTFNKDLEVILDLNEIVVKI